MPVSALDVHMSLVIRAEDRTRLVRMAEQERRSLLSMTRILIQEALVARGEAPLLALNRKESTSPNPRAGHAHVLRGGLNDVIPSTGKP